MPIFEFECRECGTPFEELLRSSTFINEVRCPECGSPQVRKKVSSFASKISGGSGFSLGSSTSSCATGGT
ncbi:MAG: zinc ribbon domain-containing protein [Chloroflexi bacterium]|nr:zinc ribbon domain-containing protein [Chloroflexota bacterium]